MVAKKGEVMIPWAYKMGLVVYGVGIVVMVIFHINEYLEKPLR
jgi:hypothetical protein